MTRIQTFTTNPDATITDHPYFPYYLPGMIGNPGQCFTCGQRKQIHTRVANP